MKIEKEEWEKFWEYLLIEADKREEWWLCEWLEWKKESWWGLRKMTEEKQKEEEQRARFLCFWNQICRQRKVEPKLGVVMKNKDKQYLGIGELKNVGFERAGEEHENRK